MEAVVFGNVTLDVICRTVDEVPRYDSVTFDQVIISPGGCGSNVAIGLSALGVPTALVCRLAQDEASFLIERFLKKAGIDFRYINRDSDTTSAVSVGLVDSNAQPRFIHTPGANTGLTVDDLKIDQLIRDGARALHIAGFFVLPGLMDGRLPETLKIAKSQGLLTTLDVVNSFRIKNPITLWPCLPHLDIFLCNQVEGVSLTGEKEPALIATKLRERGARAVIVKMGADGCLLEYNDYSDVIPAPIVENVIDTTGAGDAFASGLIASLLRGNDLETACMDGNQAGAHMVTTLGAVGAWFQDNLFPSIGHI